MKRFGPGMLVAAAFIGPGTVTTASIAGANFGFVLIWALLLSCIITFVLQEMSSRLGIVSGLGLSESLNQSIQNSTTKLCLMGLVVAAIGAGNAAFEVGNITGAAIGLNQMRRLNNYVKYRNEIAKIYNKELNNLPIITPWHSSKVYSSYHLYPICIDENLSKKSQREVYNQLRKNKIAVNLHYIPVHRHPYYENLGFKKNIQGLF